jgi:hypothetical protein
LSLSLLLLPLLKRKSGKIQELFFSVYSWLWQVAPISMPISFNPYRQKSNLLKTFRKTLSSKRTTPLSFMKSSKKSDLEALLEFS